MQRDSPPISSSSVSTATGCPWNSWIPLRGQAAARINPHHPPSRPASPCHGHKTNAGVDSCPHFSWGWGQMAPGSLARGGCRMPGQKGLAMWPPSLLGPQLNQGAPSFLPAPSAKGGWPKWTDPQAAPPLPAEPSLVQGFTLLPALLGNAMCFRTGPPRLWGGGQLTAGGRGRASTPQGLGGKVSWLMDEAHGKAAPLLLNAAVSANVAASVTLGTAGNTATPRTAEPRVLHSPRELRGLQTSHCTQQQILRGAQAILSRGLYCSPAC